MKKSDKAIIEAVTAGKCEVSISTPAKGETPAAHQERIARENPANDLLARMLADFSAGGFDDPGEDQE